MCFSESTWGRGFACSVIGQHKLIFLTAYGLQDNFTFFRIRNLLPKGHCSWHYESFSLWECNKEARQASKRKAYVGWVIEKIGSDYAQACAMWKSHLLANLLFLLSEAERRICRLFTVDFRCLLFLLLLWFSNLTWSKSACFCLVQHISLPAFFIFSTYCLTPCTLPCTTIQMCAKEIRGICISKPLDQTFLLTKGRISNARPNFHDLQKTRPTFLDGLPSRLAMTMTQVT